MNLASALVRRDQNLHHWKASRSLARVRGFLSPHPHHARPSKGRVGLGMQRPKLCLQRGRLSLREGGAAPGALSTDGWGWGTGGAPSLFPPHEWGKRGKEEVWLV